MEGEAAKQNSKEITQNNSVGREQWAAPLASCLPLEQRQRSPRRGCGLQGCRVPGMLLLPFHGRSRRAGREEQHWGVHALVPLGTWCECESASHASEHCSARRVALVCRGRRNTRFLFFSSPRADSPRTHPESHGAYMNWSHPPSSFPWQHFQQCTVTLIHRKWFNSLLRVKFLCQNLGKPTHICQQDCFSNQSYRDIPSQCLCKRVV